MTFEITTTERNVSAVAFTTTICPLVVSIKMKKKKQVARDVWRSWRPSEDSSMYPAVLMWCVLSSTYPVNPAFRTTMENSDTVADVMVVWVFEKASRIQRSRFRCECFAFPQPPSCKSATQCFEPLETSWASIDRSCEICRAFMYLKLN